MSSETDINVGHGGEPEGVDAVMKVLGKTYKGTFKKGRTWRRKGKRDGVITRIEGQFYCNALRYKECGFKGDFKLFPDGTARIRIPCGTKHTCLHGDSLNEQEELDFHSVAAEVAGRSSEAPVTISRPLHRPDAGFELRLGYARSTPIWSASEYSNWYNVFRLPHQGYQEDARTRVARETNAKFTDSEGLAVAHLRRRFDTSAQNSFLAQHITVQDQPGAITTQGRLPLRLTNRELLDIIQQYTGIATHDSAGWARQGYPGVYNVAVVMNPHLDADARQHIWNLILRTAIYLSLNGHKLPSEPGNDEHSIWINAEPRAIILMLRAGHPDIQFLCSRWGFRLFDHGVQYTSHGVVREGYEDVTVFLLGVIPRPL